MIRIDAHQHFWRHAATDYPWMDARMGVLQRDWLPQHLRPRLDAAGIDACIAVQARAQEVETDFLLALARDYPWIAAVVGWVDLRAEDVSQRLERWHGEAKLAGFRHLLQDEADVPAFLADAAFNRGVSELQSRELVYEVLVRAPQLDAVAEFCARHDRHWLVLDHLGKPEIGGASDAHWRAALRELASMPHVLCKVSGLVTETGNRAVDDTVLRRYLDIALELFGPQRLMFGSDWPVCLLNAEYAEVHAIIEDWSTRLGFNERAALWGGTAARCYGLRLPGIEGAH